MGLEGFSLFDLFREEAAMHSASLSDGLVQVEQGADAKVLEGLMRAAHSIKGAARIVGLDVAVRLAHAMEDCLVRMQKGTEVPSSARVDQLLGATDRFKALSVLDEASAKALLSRDAAQWEDLAAALEVTVVQAVPQPAASAAGPASSSPSTTVALAAAPTVQSSDAPVSVSAADLDRLVRLSGDGLVEMRRLSGSLHGLVNGTNALRRIAEQLVATGGGADATDRDLVARVDSIRRDLGHQLEQLESITRRAESRSDVLYHGLLKTRMRPFADASAALPRIARDLARQLGKSVRVEVTGDKTLVDRDVLRALEAPLNHLVRNAIDHGIEPQGERVGVGKPGTATMKVEARHHAGMLVLEVSDDGRGIDAEQVRRKVIERGLCTPEIAASLQERELLDFLFLPGFSTARNLSEVSGRGVGLDIVQSMVQASGGGITVRTQLGKGTTFSLRLPVAVSVVRALIVEVRGEPLALPLKRLEQILQPDESELQTAEGRPHLMHEGKSIGILHLGDLLELGEGTAGGELTVVVLRSDETPFGLRVDQLVGEEDLVVSPVDRRLRGIAELSASGVRQDGSPIFLLDTDAIVRSAVQLVESGRLRGAARATAAAGAALRVLVVEDSITVREVERQLLQREGYEVDVAVDGMDGWAALQSGRYAAVLTDIDMPRMNGIELIKRIRADERFKSLPVIVISYKDREEDRRAGLDAGATAYLTKGSFHDSTLAQTVADLVGTGDRSGEQEGA